MLYLLPLLLSAGIGIFTLTALLGDKRPRTPLLIMLGTLLGLGLSALVTWTSFVLFNQLIAPYAIAVNTALFCAAGWPARRHLPKLLAPGAFDPWDLAGLALLATLCIPVILHAMLYPYGGWDAWSCWNLKVKFLLCGAENWTNMFDPLLWRSNISYPILLPLMNVWVLCFGRTMDPHVPLAMSCLITFLTSGILLFGLKELTRRPVAALLGTALVFTCLFNIKLASSQYSDLLLGAWFLAALVTFFLFAKTRHRPYLVLHGTLLGLLAFTKTEGLLLAGITAILTCLMLHGGTKRPGLSKGLAWFCIAAAAAFIPAAAFLLCYAPDSHTFINGLVSTEKHAGIERLQMTGYFLGRELISLKWNGLWLITLAALIISGKRCLKKELLIIPAAVFIYLAMIGAFYYVNTFFEIAWWLSTTLNRVLFSLTPAAALWAFCALDEE